MQTHINMSAAEPCVDVALEDCILLSSSLSFVPPLPCGCAFALLPLSMVKTVMPGPHIVIGTSTFYTQATMARWQACVHACHTCSCNSQLQADWPRCCLAEVKVYSHTWTSHGSILALACSRLSERPRKGDKADMQSAVSWRARQLWQKSSHFSHDI